MASFYEQEERIKKEYVEGKLSRQQYQLQLAKVHAEMTREYKTGACQCGACTAVREQAKRRGH
jgi:heterodisulfide reductase subunit C